VTEPRPSVRPTTRPPFLVGIAGGSGSGKTRLAEALAETLGRDRVAVVVHDAYYVDRIGLAPAAREALDYDVPGALDWPLFLADLARVKAGEPVRPPRYCFATHRRLGLGPPIVPRDVVLVDGMLLLHDPGVRAELDLKIFVDAPVGVRRERRLARDVAERGRTRASVLRQFTATVHPAHVAYVEPTRAFADLVLLNAGHFAPLVEVAATVIHTHLARRQPPAPQELIGARDHVA
jgi:uridine kinase